MVDQRRDSKKKKEREVFGGHDNNYFVLTREIHVSPLT